MFMKNKKIFLGIMIISIIIILISTHFLVFLYGKQLGISQAHKELSPLSIYTEK